ncbi:MAG: hypothetical protein AAFO02_01465 [Bacteroidota bacterium]
MDPANRDNLLILKGWLLAVREELGVGYYSYLNAITRRVKHEHTSQDVQALHALRNELSRHYKRPRSSEEMMVLADFITSLDDALQTTMQIQLQTT